MGVFVLVYGWEKLRNIKSDVINICDGTLSLLGALWHES